MSQSWERPEASQGARLCRWSWLGYFPNLAHGTTFETALWLKVEVPARPQAGTGPTAGRLELAVGNGHDPAYFHHPGGNDKDPPANVKLSCDC